MMSLQNCQCNRNLEIAERNNVQSFHAKDENKRPSYCEFWKFTNPIVNRGKTSVSPIINGPEVITSSSDKAKLFVMNFASNIPLDGKRISPTKLPTFHIAQIP